MNFVILPECPVDWLLGLEDSGELGISIMGIPPAHVDLDDFIEPEDEKWTRLDVAWPEEDRCPEFAEIWAGIQSLVKENEKIPPWSRSTHPDAVASFSVGGKPAWVAQYQLKRTANDAVEKQIRKWLAEEIGRAHV